MNIVKNELNNMGFKNLDSNLKKEYAVALKDEKFKNLINNLKIKESIAYKYTSKLENTVEELSHCKACKSLCVCKNKVEGYVNYPKIEEEKLVFSYVACKYKKKELEIDNKAKYYEIPLEIKNASMKDIDINDSKRTKVIKWLKDFYDNYELKKNMKGLYLHGNFGCGKTYLIAAMLNELSKKNIDIVVVYFPELLRKLKELFDTGYKEYLDEIINSDILLIDDLGAESVTSWSRDEILGTILQHRMDNNLVTFITSNLNIDELETNLSITKNNTDKVKARRIIERIKQLTEDIEMISKNRRHM